MVRDIKIHENRAFQGVWIPEQLYRNKDLNWNEKILLVEIASLSANGECYASNAHFAEFIGVSKRRAEQMISKLRLGGYITSEVVYDKETKKVEKRILKVVDTLGFTTDEPYRKKFRGGIEKKFGTGIEKNFDEKNTVTKNTVEENNKAFSQKKNKYKASSHEDGIVEKQVKKWCKENGYTYNKRVADIINLFIRKYDDRFPEPHGHIPQRHIGKIVRSITEGFDDTLGNDVDCDYEMYVNMIDVYFDNNSYGKKNGKECDHRIYHFFNDDIRRIIHERMK